MCNPILKEYQIIKDKYSLMVLSDFSSGNYIVEIGCRKYKMKFAKLIEALIAYEHATVDRVSYFEALFSVYEVKGR